MTGRPWDRPASLSRWVTGKHAARILHGGVPLLLEAVLTTTARAGIALYTDRRPLRWSPRVDFTPARATAFRVQPLVCAVRWPPSASTSFSRATQAGGRGATKGPVLPVYIGEEPE